MTGGCVGEDPLRVCSPLSHVRVSSVSCKWSGRGPYVTSKDGGGGVGSSSQFVRLDQDSFRIKGVTGPEVRRLFLNSILGLRGPTFWSNVSTGGTGTRSVKVSDLETKKQTLCSDYSGQVRGATPQTPSLLPFGPNLGCTTGDFNRE